MELMGIGREQRNSVYTVLGRMENKRLINSRPAPGDKRFNLYSLFASKSNDAIVFHYPLPPPKRQYQMLTITLKPLQIKGLTIANTIVNR
jgi:tRNA G46 methylase TrmB